MLVIFTPALLSRLIRQALNTIRHRIRNAKRANRRHYDRLRILGWPLSITGSLQPHPAHRVTVPITFAGTVGERQALKGWPGICGVRTLPERENGQGSARHSL